jgi:hypothetical protein
MQRSVRPLLVVVAVGVALVCSAVAAEAIPNGRYAIGDSVMVGAKEELRARGFIVDAVQSRQFRDAVAIVKRKAASGVLRRKVIIHLGTNGILIQASQCDAISKYAGSKRRVFLVTVTGPTAKIRRVQNRRLRACAARRGNTLLIDWYGYSRGHGGWFYRDGIHLRATGQKAYAAFLDNKTS